MYLPVSCTQIPWQSLQTIRTVPFGTIHGVPYHHAASFSTCLYPTTCNHPQANLMVAALKRHVGFGGTTHMDEWSTKMAFETIA